jgi:PAS domain S-box-containing protein
VTGQLFFPPPVDRRLEALVAVTRHAGSAADLATFFGLLTATIADLMDAEGALFGRLDGDGFLVGQPSAHGQADDLIAQLRTPCAPGGGGFAERVVFGGEVFRARISEDPGFAVYQPVLEALGLREGLAVPWRAGDTPLGLLVVYNSRRGGFTADDVPVLLSAAHAAALVWQARRAAAELELQSAITASMAEGVLVTRADSLGIEYANSRVCQMFGYPEGGLVGKSVVSLLAAADGVSSEERVAVIRGALRDTGAWQGELLSVRRDGERFWRRVHISGIHHPEHGELWISVHSDITDQKRAIEVLAAARDAAEAASKAKSDYLSRMSHELRTPLAAIIGFADLLLLDERGRGRQGLEAILRAGEHLLAIVDDILDIARIESGKLTLSLEPVSLVPLVEECCHLIAVSAEARGIRLSCEVPGTWVLADEHRLNQVILNLLSNAVKYNREGGEIVVSAVDRPGGRVRIAIRDTGEGIERDQMELLFRPFQRLGAERAGIKGTGLGLALSRQLAEAMGGSIGARSRPGTGSTFWIDLQRCAEPAAEQPDVRDLLVPAAPVADRTVLYVEDNLASVEVIQGAFAHRPRLRLLTAMQGRVALQLAADQPVDLILLDLHLPDMHGAEVLRRLRASPRSASIPVAILSADATTRERERLRQAGALAYLIKPIRVNALLDFVDSVLSSPAAAAVQP